MSPYLKQYILNTLANIIFKWNKLSDGVQGWRSGESTRLSPNVARVWFPDSVAYAAWVKVKLLILVLAPGGFYSGTPVLPSHKNQHF